MRPAYFLTSKEKVASPVYVISISDATAMRAINNRTQTGKFPVWGGVGGVTVLRINFRAYKGGRIPVKLQGI